MYFADSRNNVIRMISSNGLISTIAGNGIQGYSGDGTDATEAELNSPWGVRVTPTEDLYFADTNNNRIRIIVNSLSSQCSYNGFFQAGNYCLCGTHYAGYRCQLSICYGVNQTSPNVCSGHGSCNAPDTCYCNTGYRGNNCQTKIRLALIALLLLIVPVLMGIVAFYLNRYRIRKKKESQIYARLLRYEQPEEPINEIETLENTNLKIELRQLSFLSKISEGAGGVVYKGLWYHQVIAIKRLKVVDKEAFVKEVSVLNRLRHPNVLELYGYTVDSRGYQYIVTEFMDKGSLDNLLYSNQLRVFEMKMKALLEIARGMSFLHGRGIIHRDLKPQNVLIHKDGVCKLCDFGLAKIMNDTITLGVVGTWQYMAPEIMSQTEAYNEKCDVYSFGIMMHEIFTLKRPYVASDNISQFAIGLQIINGFRPSIPSEIFSSEEPDEQSLASVVQYFYESNELSNCSLTEKDIFHLVRMYFELCVSLWSNDSNDRLTFDQIIVKLEEIDNFLKKNEENTTN